MGATAVKRSARRLRFGLDASSSAIQSGSPGLPAPGQRVRVLWDDDDAEMWYAGTVKHVDAVISDVLVLYDDGVEVWEAFGEGSGRTWAFEEVDDAGEAVKLHGHDPTLQVSPSTEEEDTGNVPGGPQQQGEAGGGPDGRGGRDKMLLTASIDGRFYSLTEMAIRVMREVGTWLRAGDVISAAGSRGWRFAVGDPETSTAVRSRLRDRISRTLSRERVDPVFPRKEKGIYGLAEWVHGEECRAEGGDAGPEPPPAEEMPLTRAPDLRGHPAQIADDTAEHAMGGMEAQRQVGSPGMPCQASETRYGGVHRPEVFTTAEMENGLVSALDTLETLEEHTEAVVGIRQAANEMGTDEESVPILDLERVEAPTKRKLHDLLVHTPAISGGFKPTTSGFQIEDYGELPMWGRRKEKSVRGPAAPILQQTPTAHEMMGNGFAYSEEDAASDDDDLFGDNGKWGIDLPDAQSMAPCVAGDEASVGQVSNATRHVSTCPLDLDVSPEEVADRITQVCDFVEACIGEWRLPSISLESGTASRPAFTMESNSATVRFARMMIALDIIHENLVGKGNVTEDSGVNRITQRDLFYIARSRSASIKAPQMMQTIQDVSLMLNVPRFAMGIDCRSKGMVYGPIAMGGAVRCMRPRGSPISGSVPDIMDIPSVGMEKVTAIVVVEKETVFQRIVREAPSHPVLSTCVIITGCGYPDIGTRAFLFKIAGQDRSIPVVGLVDWNACGAHILSQYVLLLLLPCRRPTAHPHSRVRGRPCKVSLWISKVFGVASILCSIVAVAGSSELDAGTSCEGCARRILLLRLHSPRPSVGEEHAGETPGIWERGVDGGGTVHGVWAQGRSGRDVRSHRRRRKGVLQSARRVARSRGVHLAFVSSSRNMRYCHSIWVLHGFVQRSIGRWIQFAQLGQLDDEAVGAR